MKRSFQKFTQWPWYPLLAGIYPVLALYAGNVNEVRLDAVARPLLIYLAGTLILLGLFRLLLRDWHRAAIVTSLWVLLFSSYGHIETILTTKHMMPPAPILSVVWVVLMILVFTLTINSRINFASASRWLNLVGLVMLVYPLYQVGSVVVQNLGDGNREVQAAASQQVHISDPSKLPDIYYIILDSYGRQDLLKQAYQYDNSGFINDLRQMGFYVADCSMSNYMRTDISLTTSLNMDYLTNLGKQFTPDTYNRVKLFDLLKHSAVRQMLEQAGYQTVAFSTGFPWSELDDASHFLGPNPLKGDMTDFEELLLKTTLARLLEDYGVIDPFQVSSQHFRDRTTFDLDSLSTLASVPGPKFVFMHVISPHPPFVYGPDGKPTDPAQFLDAQEKYTSDMYAQGYTNQVSYLTPRLEAGLKDLISSSRVPPIIIIQGDHGPWMQPNNQHFWILNAYYLPDESQLYSTISPVNSFRLVLNQALGTHYELLKDKSYFSPIPYIYDFSPYTNTCQH